MNKFIYIILFIFFSSHICFSAVLSNRYLLVDVDDETGRIFISTVEGKEEIKGDEKARLLFYDIPPSSYTLIFLDDDAMVFGNTSRGNFTTRPLVIGQSIRAVWENEQISVEQIVQFVPRKETGIEDGVRISYSIENKLNYNVKIGLRILFDTFLGEWDIYHFTLAGGKKLRYEAEYNNDNIPLFWISEGSGEQKQLRVFRLFRSKKSSEKSIRDEGKNLICIQGTIKGPLVTTPDRVVFANYKYLNENYLNVHPRRKNSFDQLPFSRNDSAVALYYDQKELPPGTSRVYSTILGLCGEGDYAEEKAEVIIKEERKIPPEKPAEKEILRAEEMLPPSEIDFNSIEKIIDKVQRNRENLKNINQIISELNDALQKEDKSLSQEELLRLKEKLSQLEINEQPTK